MNLTGHWKGHYTYGKEYPIGIAGTSEPFDIDIDDADGNLTGNCTDFVVREVEGNSASIIGTFSNNRINFVKRYKYQVYFDEDGSVKQLEDNSPVDFDGIHYAGTLKKSFFSRKVYLKGKWSIFIHYTLEDGSRKTFICTGTWQMNKIESSQMR